ncbi:MAG: two component, sigma54 specific, transcriptional regulator, Fis family [Steroidobacteraceae bacterium]|jgi:DNA-binding NtrC family response regulator|nr:two component, sigma54 specific, transcriptional regulator, Fis family [Steroidobacteraceae bacterium]
MDMSGALLVVDDDVDVVRAARLALSLRHEKIDALNDIGTIELQVAATNYDAILLDMNFAAQRRDGSQGMDALSRILATDPDVSVILMTAFGSVNVAVEALKRGAVDFILKPWANDKLEASVAAAVDSTRRRRAAAGNLDIETLEKKAIEAALARAKGNLSVAATSLGLSRPALYRRLSKYGLLP